MARHLMLSLMVFMVLAVAVHEARRWGNLLDSVFPSNQNHQPRKAAKSGTASWFPSEERKKTRHLSADVVELLEESCSDGTPKQMDFQNICNAFLKTQGCNQRVAQGPDHHTNNHHHDNHHYEEEIHTNDQFQTGEEAVAQKQDEDQSNVHEYQGRDPDIDNFGGFFSG